MNIVKNTNGNVEFYLNATNTQMSSSIPSSGFRGIWIKNDGLGVIISTSREPIEVLLVGLTLNGTAFTGTASELGIELSANFFFKPLVDTDGLADGAITDAKLAPELQKAYLLGGCITDQIITDDDDNPTLFSDFQVGFNRWITLEDAATSTFKNESGRALNLSGTFSYTPDKGVGINLSLVISAEVSIDNGATWAIPVVGKRTVEISNNSESFGSKIFSLVGIPDGALFRYMAYRVGGALTFTSSPSIIKGQTVLSPIVDIELQEI